MSFPQLFYTSFSLILLSNERISWPRGRSSRKEAQILSFDQMACLFMPLPLGLNLNTLLDSHVQWECHSKTGFKFYMNVLTPGFQRNKLSCTSLNLLCISFFFFFGMFSSAFMGSCNKLSYQCPAFCCWISCLRMAMSKPLHANLYM